MVNAIGRELELQIAYLGNEKVNTIYFGGGTPSLLSDEQLRYLMKIIQYEFDISSNPEITLEANPDDLSNEKLESLFKNGINRLSIGLQSFHEDHLKWLNRAHTAKDSKECVIRARQSGFENISLDLIYAIPHDDHTIWKKDLSELIQLRPDHISSYCLTIEPKTAFGKWLEKGKIKEINEEYAAEQFEILLDETAKYGYEQYEISNFAQPGYESQHNSNYWKQEKYLGVGPSAHSYDGKNRQANVSNNAGYMKSLDQKLVPFELLELSQEDQINEYILTSLRTKWGCDLERVMDRYQVDLLRVHERTLTRFLDQGMIFIEDGFITLTNNGKLLADKIASDLFIDSSDG